MSDASVRDSKMICASRCNGRPSTEAIAPSLWRNAQIYRSILAGGRPALAWELLRRDPAYCLSASGRVFCVSLTSISDSDCAAQWGLHFP